MNRLILSVVLFGLAISASAGTLASFTASGTAHNDSAYGQSVTTPDGGPWDNIGFNLINADTTDPYAIGGLYVLTQQYLGTPASLSSSTAGYLDYTNTIDNGIWKFSDLTLNPDTQYYFYMDSIVPLGQAVLLTESGGTYAGGDAYGAGGGSFVDVSGADMQFVLTGDQVTATPEPGTLALAFGAAGLIAALRRRKTAANVI